MDVKMFAWKLCKSIIFLVGILAWEPFYEKQAILSSKEVRTGGRELTKINYKLFDTWDWSTWNVWKHFSHLYFRTSLPMLRNLPAKDRLILITSADLHLGHFLSVEKILIIALHVWVSVKVGRDVNEVKVSRTFDKMVNSDSAEDQLGALWGTLNNVRELLLIISQKNTEKADWLVEVVVVCWNL